MCGCETGRMSRLGGDFTVFYKGLIFMEIGILSRKQDKILFWAVFLRDSSNFRVWGRIGGSSK